VGGKQHLTEGKDDKKTNYPSWVNLGAAKRNVIAITERIIKGQAYAMYEMSEKD
jgi:hypothetical protein